MSDDNENFNCFLKHFETVQPYLKAFLITLEIVKSKPLPPSLPRSQAVRVYNMHAVLLTSICNAILCCL